MNLVVPDWVVFTTSKSGRRAAKWLGVCPRCKGTGKFGPMTVCHGNCFGCEVAVGRAWRPCSIKEANARLADGATARPR